MNKIKKKTAVLLCLIMMASTIPGIVYPDAWKVQAAESSEEFVIEDGVLKEYKGDGGDVVIPEGVTQIVGGAFRYCSSLTSIKIPEGVTEIGSYAFEDCSSLTSIKIPEGVTEIQYGAFRYCSSLTSIRIPEGVTWIGGVHFVVAAA